MIIDPNSSANVEGKRFYTNHSTNINIFVPSLNFQITNDGYVKRSYQLPNKLLKSTHDLATKKFEEKLEVKKDPGSGLWDLEDVMSSIIYKGEDENASEKVKMPSEIANKINELLKESDLAYDKDYRSFLGVSADEPIRKDTIGILNHFGKSVQIPSELLNQIEPYFILKV